MTIHLQYGRDGLEIALPTAQTTVLAPQYVPGLADEHAAFLTAVRAPIGGRPLAACVVAHERVAVVVPDLTRPFPSARVLPWLLAELAHVPAAQITILNGTGTHRANTPEELDQMLGPGIARHYRVVNHAAHDASGVVRVGQAADGSPVSLARAYVEADRRIVLGFIEPHFFAGFSGGYKGVFPALGDLAAIMRYHSAEIIGDPRSTWGRLDDNPTQAVVRHHGALLPVDFLVNLTLNRERQISRFFCGAVLPAHAAGCAFARATAMVACPQRYPLVVTTNSGYPLDQNLYQTVKGLAAASEIVAPGGLILCAARCNDGFPAHGHFRELLFAYDSPAALLAAIRAPGFAVHDQWSAQKLALILARARVALVSELAPADVRRAHLEPVADLPAFLAAELAKLPATAPIAVLPEGPQTIPYLAPDAGN